MLTLERQQEILEIFRKIPWGYAFKFFLSASNDCHPNYVTFLMDKKKLSVKSISEILDQIEEGKKLSSSCTQELEAVRQRIEKVVSGNQEPPQVEPLDIV
jgi:ABC-type Fe3+-hydroxamate transport system substrate-binding protein